MNEKITQIKNNVTKHVTDHKRAYIIGGAVVGVSAIAAGSYILGARSVPREVENFTNVEPKNIINGLAWKPVQTIEVTIEALGDPGNIIQDVTTGTIYASQRQAADAIGASTSRMSKHLITGLGEINGHVFKNLGKAHVTDALA